MKAKQIKTNEYAKANKEMPGNVFYLWISSHTTQCAQNDQQKAQMVKDNQDTSLFQMALPSNLREGPNGGNSKSLDCTFQWETGRDLSAFKTIFFLLPMKDFIGRQLVSWNRRGTISQGKTVPYSSWNVPGVLVIGSVNPKLTSYHHLLELNDHSLGHLLTSCVLLYSYTVRIFQGDNNSPSLIVVSGQFSEMLSVKCFGLISLYINLFVQ